MNSKLSDAISRVQELPEDRQEAAAALLLDFLEHGDPEAALTPEQIAELDLRLEDNDVATDEEVQAFFARFKA
jgi:hypothetical protein